MISHIGPDLAAEVLSKLAAEGASEAWMHPLGFIHIRMGTFEGVRTRVHIWPKKTISTDPAHSLCIHNHAFEFQSRVLTGAVTHQPYDVVAGPKGSCSLFEVRNSERGAAILPTSTKCSIHPGPVSVCKAGVEYRVESGVFHRSAALEDLTATLVLARPVAGVTSYLVGLVWSISVRHVHLVMLFQSVNRPTHYGLRDLGVEK